MMRWTFQIAAVAVAFLMLSVTFQPAVAEMYDDDFESRAGPFDEIPGPFRDLDRIVAQLQARTTDRTDTDNDTIFDSVERIIGTDPNNFDSDFDLIPDMDEVSNLTDPMSSDSNRDGVPDSQEVIDGVMDIDGDGVPNAWDSDNDGDGVTDDRDMSPYATTAVDWNHHIEMNTSGGPTTVSLQLRTSNPNTMRLVNQVWDWPYDTQGTVRDLDNSTEDVTAVPMMEITGDFIPTGPEVESYGIVAMEDAAYVPLYPIWHQGNIVALQGQMFFPENASVTELDFDVRVIWKVTGTTDSPKISMKAVNGKYLSLHDDNVIRATATEVNETELFEMLDLEEGRVALLASNGKYLSSFMGSQVRASSTSIKDSSMFLLEEHENGRTTLFRETIGAYYDIDFDDGVLVPQDDVYRNWFGFVIEDQGVATSSIPLAIYPERFALTGIVVQESFGTDVAMVYHNDSLEQAIGLNLYMAYNFLRNSTNDAVDIPELLWNEGLDVGVDVRSFDRLDLAMQAIVENMTDMARRNFPDGMDLPVITAIQQRYTVLDMAMLDQGTHTGVDDLVFDLGAQELIVKKHLKTTHYNNSGAAPVPIEYVFWSMKDWDMDPNDLNTVMVMMIAWNIGETVIVKIGGRLNDVVYPELVLALNISLKGLKYGMTGLKSIVGVIGFVGTIIHGIQGAIAAYQAFNSFMKGVSVFGRVLYMIDALDNIGHLVDITKQLSTAWTGVAKIGKGFFNFIKNVGKVFAVFSVIALILDIGIALVTLYAIGSAHDWSSLGTYTAVLTGIMMTIWAIALFVLALLSFIPKVGIIFTIISLLITISDFVTMLIFGKGWVQMVMDLIVDLLTNIKVLAPLEVSKDSSGVEIDDKDDNGLTAGDRITYYQRMTVHTNSSKLTRDQVNETYLTPTVKVTVPNYSNSKTGKTYTVNVNWHPYRDDRTQNVEATGWVEPGIGMVNFPVSVWMQTSYKTIYEECWWLFGWHCENKYTEDSVYTNPFRIYFDVMPGTIQEFANWRGIRSNDYDGDGIKDVDENRSSRYRWDTDGDGLGDPYELRIGTNPREYDTDFDGLSDKLEHEWGYDPHSTDTDGDGLSDYFEHSGWIVSFTYNGWDYDWHRNSDPAKNDTDGDGLTDLEEWLTLQNPRSVDTDGDGVNDRLRDYTLTTLEHVTTLSGNPSYAWPWHVTTDGDGYVYTATALFDWYPEYIQKYTPDGTLVKEFGLDGHITDMEAISVDRDGNLFISDYSNGILKYSSDGTYMTTVANTGPNAIMLGMAIDFDEDNNMYILDSPRYGAVQYTVVKVFDRNGTYQYQFGSRGTGEDQFTKYDNRLRCAPDGTLLLINRQLEIVQVFEKDGTFVRKYDGTGLGSEPFGSITGVDMDDEGDIYIADGGLHRIQKMDGNGRWITTFDANNTLNGSRLSPQDIVVAPDGQVYFSDHWHEGIIKVYQNLTIVKVDQKVFNDTDDDGLVDEIEDTEWSINVTFVSGPRQFDVTSDLNNPDTDGDGLGDLEEYNISTNPESADTDHDGMDDLEEVLAGTDPTHFDSDGDTLDDGLEMEIGSNPRMKDTDGEGLTDDKEFELGSDPADTDTDDDGLDDFKEYGFGSDIFNADSDDDFMFDSREFELGISPNMIDFDEDGLIDGFEDVFETDAKNGDSDGDNLPDGFEVAMIMNPLSNDTDGDGVEDGEEIDRGLNPRSADSDGDGVPDGLDKDYELELDGDVYLVVDPRYDSVSFVEDLSKKAHVIIVTPEELLLKHKRARYIVLLGDPTTEEGTAGSLVHDLLSDAPDVRESMNGSEDAHIAVRYGKWASEQTIVMLSRAYHSDHYRVIGILKSMTVKITDGVLTYNYHNPRSCFKLDDIDTIKATDAAIWTQLDEMAVFSVDIAKYDEDGTPRRLTEDNGLEEGDVPIGKYIEVGVSENLLSDEGDLITGATIWVYYTTRDLDRTGDGDADDPVDIDETTLALYLFDENEGRWVKLTADLDWVEAVSIDTEDIEMYGESYAGVLRADITHLSLFSAGGRILSDIVVTADPGDDITAKVGEEAAFDGSASEGIGGIARYTWTFTYDWQTVTLRGEEPTFTFMKAGEYQVTLEVRDAFGGTGTATFTVSVEPIKVLVRVGPIVDGSSTTVFNTSTSIHDASVHLTWGDDVYEATTDFSGFADMMIPTAAVGKDVTLRVTAEGFEPQEFTTSFTADGVLETQPSDMVASEVTEPPAKDAEGPDGWEWGIVIFAMVLALLALLILVGKRPTSIGKKEEKAGGKKEK